MGNYVLKQWGIDDYDFVYSVKKATLKCYIEKIWGWDEEYQRKDFQECYNALNNKIIMNKQRNYTLD